MDEREGERWRQRDRDQLNTREGQRKRNIRERQSERKRGIKESEERKEEKRNGI